MKKFSLLVALASGVAFSHAQSLSSFQLVDNLSGLSAFLNGNTLSMTAAAAPSFALGSITYTITEVFGVWALDTNDDQNATGGNQGGWNFNQNTSGTGGIAGFKTNPNSGVVGQTKSFNFNSIVGTPENFGYHVRVAGTLPGGSNTLFIQAVPEPATLAVVGLGLAVLIRRRKSA